MVKVCIQKKLLPVADMLLEIFTMRMADAVLFENINAKSRVGNTTGITTSKISQSHDVFLCSSEFAEQNGGTTGIVDLARGMKAKKLMIIGHDDGDQFFVSHEMNGKLIRLTIPIAAEKNANCDKL